MSEGKVRWKDDRSSEAEARALELWRQYSRKGKNLGRCQEQSNGDCTGQQTRSLERLLVAMLHQAEKEIDRQDNRDVYRCWRVASQNHECKGDRETDPVTKSGRRDCISPSMPE